VTSNAVSPKTTSGGTVTVYARLWTFSRYGASIGGWAGRAAASLRSSSIGSAVTKRASASSQRSSS